MKALQALVARYDYSAFGGAPLLGIDGICIICHGSSKEAGDRERARRRRQERPGRSSTRRSSQELEALPRWRTSRQCQVRVQSSRFGLDLDLALGLMVKTAFLFPGQGAQNVGMGRRSAGSLPAAKALFDQAAAVLGYDLLDVCANGPAERLNATDVSQPAIFVASLAALEPLEADRAGRRRTASSPPPG